MADYLSITHVEPAVGWSEDVPTLPQITVRFNQPLRVDAVNTDTGINQYVILVRMDTDQPVPVTFTSWTGSSRTLAFTPAAELAPGATYQVTIRKEVPSSSGRSMTMDRTWAFQTGLTTLGQVALREPGDSTAFVQPPVLSWNPVDAEDVTYEVQLSTDWQFGADPLWATEVTPENSGPISVEIGAVLNSQCAYYWRVRAVTAAVCGAWSDVRAFWIGDANQTEPSTIQSYHPESDFVVQDLFPDGLPGNLAEWPRLGAIFSQAIDPDSIYVQLMVSPMETDNWTSVEAEASLNEAGNVLTVTPSGEIAQNSRYQLLLGPGIRSYAGEYIAPLTTAFLGPIQPFYGSVSEVRSLMRGVVVDYTDGEITRYLWHGSLDIHRLLRSAYDLRLPTLDDLVQYTPDNEFWHLHQYVNYYAAVEILQGYYQDVLADAGQRTDLGNVSIQVDTRVLEAIQARINYLDGRRQIVANRMGCGTRIRTIIPNSRWRWWGPEGIDFSGPRRQWWEFGAFDPRYRGGLFSRWWGSMMTGATGIYGGALAPGTGTDPGTANMYGAGFPDPFYRWR